MYGTGRARVVSRSVVRGIPERDACCCRRMRARGCSEARAALNVRCSRVYGEAAQSPNLEIAGPRLLSRLTGVGLEGDHRIEPIDRRSTCKRESIRANRCRSDARASHAACGMRWKRSTCYERTWRVWRRVATEEMNSTYARSTILST